MMKNERIVPPEEQTTEEKVDRAIRFIRAISSQHNIALAYSSGKDSQILSFLVKEAGRKVDIVHNVTTIDPEGTISFALKNGARISRPRMSFLDLVELKGYPTMFRRFCCVELKEKYIADYLLLGIRKNESVKRTKCYSRYESIRYYSKNVFSNQFFPMLDFTDEDIVNIVNSHSIEMHPLYYDHAGKFCVERRLGCIGCPLLGDRGKKDFLSYPRLLKLVLKRGILFHQRMGRSEHDAALNLVYNLFYSNGKKERFQQTYQGLFDTDPWEILSEYFFIDKDQIMEHLPKPKFQRTCKKCKI